MWDRGQQDAPLLVVSLKDITTARGTGSCADMAGSSILPKIRLAYSHSLSASKSSSACRRRRPPPPLPPPTLGLDAGTAVGAGSASSRNRNIALNHEIMELGIRRDWEGLLNLAVRSSSSFNHINCSTLLSQLGRHYPNSKNENDPRLEWFLHSLASTLEKQGTAGLDWMPPREASNIVHALARLQCSPSSTLSSIFLASPPSHHCHHHHTRRILDWISHPPTATRFVQTASLPQTIANVIWSCAHLHHFKAARQLLQALEQQGGDDNDGHHHVDDRVLTLSSFVKHGQPQDFSNTLYAAARSGYPVRNLWKAIESSTTPTSNSTTTTTTTASAACVAARKIVYQGTAQAVANTAWSCATLQLEPPQFLQAVEERADGFLQTGSAQQVANTVWACASLNYAVPRLIRALNRRAEWLCRTGTPQAVANTVYACAVLGLHHHHQQQQQPQHSFDRDDDHDNFAIFGAVEQHVDKLVQGGTVQAVVNTCYALAISGWVAEQQRRRQQEQSQRFQDTATRITCVPALWERAIQSFQAGHEFRDEELRQLAQAQILWKAQQGSSCCSSSSMSHIMNDVLLCKPVPPAMAQRMERVLLNLCGNLQSKESLQISETLRAIGYEHQAEVDPNAIHTSTTRTPPGVSNDESGKTTAMMTPTLMMMAVDFASVEQQIALEVDGPSHFLKEVGTGNLTTFRNGPTQAKRDYLQRLGWTVVSLDFRDCNAARQAGTLSQFLQHKMEDAIRKK